MLWLGRKNRKDKLRVGPTHVKKLEMIRCGTCVGASDFDSSRRTTVTQHYRKLDSAVREKIS
jgi:hypothetical protein